MVGNDNQGKKMTSLRSPLWRRLLDVYPLSSPSCSAPYMLKQEAPAWQALSARL